MKLINTDVNEKTDRDKHKHLVAIKSSWKFISMIKNTTSTNPLFIMQLLQF